MRLLEIRAQLDGSPKRGDRAGKVAGGLKLQAQVILRLRLPGILVDRFAKCVERARVIALAAQRLAQPAIRSGVSRVQLDGASKLGSCGGHISLLPFSQPQAEARFGVAGLDRQRFPVVFGGAAPILMKAAIEARLAVLLRLATGRGQHQNQQIGRRSHYQMNFALICPMRGARALVTSPNWPSL